MTTQFYEQMLEYDISPYVIFTNDGKLYKYNKEADYLLSLASRKELFDLATKYAPQDYGFENKYLSLSFGRMEYYSIMVGYLDDEYIMIKFYQKVKENFETNIDDGGIADVNIFTLLKLSTSTILNGKNIDEYFDPSIPEIKLNVNNFLKLINNICEVFLSVESLSIKLQIKTGEYIIIDGKRRQICHIEFCSRENISFDSTQLKQLAYNLGIDIHFDIQKDDSKNANMIYIELPIIL
jgi:hypothetical protein